MIRKFKTGIVLLILFFGFFKASAQANTALEKADSLFNTQKYTEAFGIYDSIFRSGKATDAMLLKMAFIREGLDDYTGTLYYLDQYYQLTADKQVLYKMEELAKAQGLKGYQVDDRRFFLNILQSYQSQIMLALTAVIVVLFFGMYMVRRKGSNAWGLAVVMVLLCLALGFLVNGGLQENRALIDEQALLMSGPSAASEPVERVNRGHRVEILDESDVWAEIRWEDRTVYIRNSKIRKY